MSPQPLRTIRVHLAMDTNIKIAALEGTKMGSKAEDTNCNREDPKNKIKKKIDNMCTFEDVNVEDIPLPPEDNDQVKKWTKHILDPYESYMSTLLEKVTRPEPDDLKSAGNSYEHPFLVTSTDAVSKSQPMSSLSKSKDIPSGASQTSVNTNVLKRLSWNSPFPVLHYDHDPETAITKNIFDSHCHLDRMFRWHRKELNLIFNDAKKAESHDKIPNVTALTHLKTIQNVGRCFGSKFEGCISVCCDPELWQEKWFEWLIQDPNVWLTYGCHPGKANIFDSLHEKWMRNKLNHPRVVALGEIGLDDTFYDKVSKIDQIKVFKTQLDIAKTMQVPICIHLRGDVIKDAEIILENSGLPNDWNIHMHCFTYSVAIMERWKDKWRNMKFGLTPNYFKAEVGKLIDLDSLLLETDAPYFIPSMLRKSDMENPHVKPLCENGNVPSSNNPTPCKIGVPGMVFHVAQQIAILKNISVEKILAKNRQNIEDCYGLTQDMVLEEERKLQVPAQTKNGFKLEFIFLCPSSVLT